MRMYVRMYMQICVYEEHHDAYTKHNVMYVPKTDTVFHIQGLNGDPGMAGIKGEKGMVGDIGDKGRKGGPGFIGDQGKIVSYFFHMHQC